MHKKLYHLVVYEYAKKLMLFAQNFTDLHSYIVTNTLSCLVCDCHVYIRMLCVHRPLIWGKFDPKTEERIHPSIIVLDDKSTEKMMP